MKKLIPFLLALMLALPGAALAGEGDPLLSVDDLLLIEDSYAAFLEDLESLIVSRGLLSPNDREAWRSAQMGDFFQNGGYGSILANYMPGILDYVREEDTHQMLSCALSCGTLELSTVRRYTPQDSSLSGLMLTFSLSDAQGLPLNATIQLSAQSGLFLKWDAVTGSYVSVGTSAQSDGDTICWSAQTPVTGAIDPVISIYILNAEDETPLGKASLTLSVDGDGYLVNNNALSGE